MTPIGYIVIAGAVLLVVVTAGAWLSIRTYFNEKRRSLREMLNGQTKED